MIWELEFEIWKLIFLIPIFLYLILILWIAHHWFHSKIFSNKEQTPKTKVSVLIPFKNERANLPRLISSLRAQNFSNTLVEYIFINDHSDDGGEKLIPTDFRQINSDRLGKKAALLCGLAVANGELIITIDADCTMGEEWLSALVSFYEKEQSDLIICPVNIAPATTVWEKIQAVEFQSLVASTAGAALGGKPIMCNGANLAYRKSLVDVDEDIFNENYSSGDDMFVLEFAKAKKKKIDYLKSQEAMVSTSPVSWKGFWKQRSRWTSKAGGYKDVEIILVGLVVFMANVALLGLLFFSVSNFLVALCVKGIVDLLLLAASACFFKTTKSLWLYPLILPFYPFYVILAALLAIRKNRQSVEA